MPGTCDMTLPMVSANASNVLAETHSSLSFKMIIKSDASIDIGSVGISPAPILVTIFSISGKRSINNFEAFCVASKVVFNELPLNNLVSTAKSPSSNLGINSPPRPFNNIKAQIKSVIVNPIICFGIFNALINNGS